MAFARNFVNISFEVKFLLFSWPGYEPSSKTKRKKLSMDGMNEKIWYIISMEIHCQVICDFANSWYLVFAIFRTFGICKADQLMINSMNMCHVFLGIQKPYYYKFLCVNSEGKITTSSGGTKGIENIVKWEKDMAKAKTEHVVKGTADIANIKQQVVKEETRHII
eukprot:54680_1